MNPDNNYNSVENPHNDFSKTKNPKEDPIDAEIIAETPVNPSTLDEEENPINLTYYPVVEEEEPTQPENDDPFPVWLKQGLIALSTPWGLGSLLLIVLTNVAIVGVQLWKLQQTPKTSPSATLNQETPSTNLSIPKSLNVARKSPNKVVLDGLSTVSTPSQSSQKIAKPSVKPSSPTQQVVNVNQPPSLTNAILPPSLQPQTQPNNLVSTTPLKVPQPPKTAPIRSSIPVAEIPRPLPTSVQPSTVPSMTIQPPPPPMNISGMSEDDQVRQAIKQQLKIEENNQSNVPLGFNHKTRLEMQNGMNELPPQLLPQQVNYLEQLQQREVLDSATPQGVNIE